MVYNPSKPTRVICYPAVIPYDEVKSILIKYDNEDNASDIKNLNVTNLLLSLRLPMQLSVVSLLCCITTNTAVDWNPFLVLHF